jgi:hypothetical protein
LGTPAHLDLWWSLWLGGLMASQLADRIALADDFEYLSWLGPLNAVSTLLTAGAFVLWLELVTSVVRLQEAAASSAA